MDYYDRQDELYHYGRKGMKWGQHIFGKVKSGAARVGKKISDAHQKKKAEKAADRLRKKPYSKLTDAELKERIQRMQLEKNLKDLDNQVNPTTKKGSKFLSSVTEAAGQAFINAGKESLTNLIKKRLNKALGLTDELDDLKDEFNKLDYQKKIADLKKGTSEIQELRDKAEKSRLTAEIERNERERSPEAAKRREKEDKVKDVELDKRYEDATRKPSALDKAADDYSKVKKVAEGVKAEREAKEKYGDTAISDAIRDSSTRTGMTLFDFLGDRDLD